jgi:hypothetical protein
MTAHTIFPLDPSGRYAPGSDHNHNLSGALPGRHCPGYRPPINCADESTAFVANPLTTSSTVSARRFSPHSQTTSRARRARRPAGHPPARPASKAFYDQKRAEGKRHNAAVICLARRRRDVILAMLRTRQPYRSTRHTPSLADAA